MSAKLDPWTRRRVAARAYRPKRVRLLIVAESPPADPARYVYFDDEGTDDELFRELCAVLFEEPPGAGEKIPYLKELRRRGVFLAELKPDAPRAKEPLGSYVAPLLLNLDALAPEAIALVGTEVHAAAHAAMKKAGLPVLDAKVPAPAKGHEQEFRQKLRQALIRAGLETLIRPLPASKARRPGPSSAPRRIP